MLSRDPADLFAQLYDEITDDPLGNPAEVARWLDEEPFGSIAQVTEIEARLGSLDPSGIRVAIDESGEPAGHTMAVLLGLNRALRDAHPATASPSNSAVVEVAARYALTGKFTTDSVSGALLPRFCSPREIVTPTQRYEIFQDVVRVPKSSWDSATHVVLTALQDITAFTPPDIPIVCAPALDAIDDLTVEVGTRGPRKRSWFRMYASNEAGLEQTARQLLELLDGSRARIAVLPECALNKDLLEFWQQLVLDMPAPEGGRLQWILVGSGPIYASSPHTNTGVLIHRQTGEVLLRQDKIHPFVMDANQLKDWGLTEVLGRKSTQEDIERGAHLTILESRVGRLALLICEDLARVMELGQILRDHAVSLVLTPIFSKEIREWHWEHSKARDHAQEVGTRTVIANSLIVPTLVKDALPAGTAMFVSPQGYSIGVSEDRHALTIFEVPLFD